MLEYRIESAITLSGAENIMNEMSKKGWKVVSTVYWAKCAKLAITFEREKR